MVLILPFDRPRLGPQATGELGRREVAGASRYLELTAVGTNQNASGQSCFAKRSAILHITMRLMARTRQSGASERTRPDSGF